MDGMDFAPRGARRRSVSGGTGNSAGLAPRRVCAPEPAGEDTVVLGFAAATGAPARRVSDGNEYAPAAFVTAASRARAIMRDICSPWRPPAPPPPRCAAPARAGYSDRGRPGTENTPKFRSASTTALGQFAQNPHRQGLLTRSVQSWIIIRLSKRPQIDRSGVASNAIAGAERSYHPAQLTRYFLTISGSGSIPRPGFFGTSM